MPAGSSAKPLAEKLGIKEGFAVVVIHPPKDYKRLLGRLPERVTIWERLDGRVDITMPSFGLARTWKRGSWLGKKFSRQMEASGSLGRSRQPESRPT